MANPAKYVWVDDELKDAAQASVPVVNAGLHYGFSVFEGIRCYATEHGAAVFRLEEHVDRLLDSAHIVGFRDLPWNREGLIDAIHKRSEEHTSELQSHSDLVCRLLLEKKKKD